MEPAHGIYRREYLVVDDTRHSVGLKDSFCDIGIGIVYVGIEHYEPVIVVRLVHGRYYFMLRELSALW